MKKVYKQLLIIFGVVLFFFCINFLIYNIFTYRCINRYGEDMQAKSVELDEYLPFDENSKIVDEKASITLTGDLPVLDGAAALYPVFSAFANSLYPKDSVSFDGENFAKNSALQYSNTRGSYKAVVDGDVDIIFCAAPSDSQLDYAKENGVELELVPIGREAFVFIVNKNNPVDSLTVDQVKGIYSGEYTNWRELGGKYKRIGALTRNEGSGSQTAMLAFMGDTPIQNDYDSFLGSAIGFSFRFYVEDLVDDGNVKMLALNGVYPSEENIRNGSYPIVSNFYAIYRKDNDNENIKTMIEWILSDEGQGIIEKTGYVGLK